MANVLFNRVEDSTQLDNIPVVDGSFYVTGDGKSFIDYGEERLPVGGTPDTEMSDRSTNAVENNVIKQYVDNSIISRKLLWTNPNPNNAFSPQDITLNSDDYDILEIYYYDWSGDSNSYKDLLVQRAIKGYNFLLHSQITYNDKAYAGNRRVTYVNDTTLHFQNTHGIIDDSSFNTGLFAKWNVPLYVIGYKTGLFE